VVRRLTQLKRRKTALVATWPAVGGFDVRAIDGAKGS
jgi:hypothetical protein